MATTTVFEEKRLAELEAVQRAGWRVVLFFVLPVILAFNLVLVLTNPCWQTRALLGGSAILLATWAFAYFRAGDQSKRVPLGPVVGSAIVFTILSMLLREGASAGTGFALLSISTYVSLFSERALRRTIVASAALFAGGLVVNHLGLIPQIPQTPGRVLAQTILYVVVFFGAAYYSLRTNQRISAALFEKAESNGRRKELALHAVGRAAPELASAIANLRPMADGVAANAAQQAGVSSQIGTSLELIQLTVANTASSAQDARAVAVRIRDDAAKGLEKLKGLEGAFDDVVRRTESVRRQNDELAREVARTEEINAALRGISARLLVMAMNASLEAARAGEYGRGFSVVAAELKRMVDQSNADLGRADKLLEHLRERAALISRENDASTEALRGSYDELMSVAGLLESITSSFQAASSSVEAIAFAAQQQRAGISEIAEGSGELVRAAADLSSSSDGMRDGLARVEAAHDQLRRLLDGGEAN